MQNASAKTTPFYHNFLIFFPTLFVYLLTLYPTVGSEDSGEFIVSAANLDIAHPSGYPLHTLLGWLFSHLIFFGNVGWRLNLFSAFFAAATVTALYIFLKRLLKSDTVAFCFCLFFAFTDIFWSQAIRTEVYTLNMFFLVIISYLLLLWHESEKRKYLYLTALMFGLSLSNHHMMALAAPPIIFFVLIRKWKEIFNPKNIIICLLLFFVGLLPYAYLPIRSSIAPYTNPAYMKHDPLNTWDKFTGFVNRNIYGGTIALSASEQNSSTQTAETENFLGKISKTAIDYGTSFVSNNAAGFIPMMQIIFYQLLWIPLILFIPGIYYIIRKNGKYSVYLLGLFIFYTVIQLKFIGVSANLHPFTLFSNRPFYISSILVLAIISAAGLKLLFEQLKNPLIKNIATVALIVLPVLAIIPNFSSNNESNNYIAHDFNKNLLDSVPQNGYFISTGKDNFTFPLYYLKKIDNYRTDISLEIYYGRTCPDKSDLDEKLKASGKQVLFIDLLPCNYKSLNLVPYNFVYAYGDTSGLPPSRNIESFTIRGIKDKLDYPNGKLAGIHYLKMAYGLQDQPEKQYALLDKVFAEYGDYDQFKNFILDYIQDKDATGLF